MKEDAQLVCSIGYEDPSTMWKLLENDLIARFPLEKLCWKHPITQLEVNIDSLPLRCMPLTSTLFKDTDHSFRWFLAPYVHIYILVCEGFAIFYSYVITNNLVHLYQGWTLTKPSNQNSRIG